MKGSTGYQGGNVGITGAVDDAMAMNQAQAMTQAGPFDAQARGEQDQGGSADPATETLSTPQQAIDAAFNTLSMSPDVLGTLRPRSRLSRSFRRHLRPVQGQPPRRHRLTHPGRHSALSQIGLAQHRRQRRLRPVRRINPAAG